MGVQHGILGAFLSLELQSDPKRNRVYGGEHGFAGSIFPMSSLQKALVGHGC